MGITIHNFFRRPLRWHQRRRRFFVRVRVTVLGVVAVHFLTLVIKLLLDEVGGSYDSFQEDRHVSKFGGSGYDSVQEVATGASAATGDGDNDVLGSDEGHGSRRGRGSLSNIGYQVAVGRGRGTPGSYNSVQEDLRISKLTDGSGYDSVQIIIFYFLVKKKIHILFF